MLTMLKLKCPSCYEKFILYQKESKKKIKNFKRPKNISNLFSERVKKALKLKNTERLFTKFHYEIIK